MLTSAVHVVLPARSLRG
ncbi:hypothetical protein ABTZ58_27885 [Streptomyces sp. NPDC094143]